MNLGHLDFDIVSNFACPCEGRGASYFLFFVSRYASRFTLHEIALYICRESSTNRQYFMQNEPNFPESQMNVNKVLTKDYDNKTLSGRGKKQSQTNPNKAKFKKAKMNVTSILTVAYENKTPIRAPKKQSQISKRQKPMQPLLTHRIMKKTAISGPGKTNPIQTQSRILSSDFCLLSSSRVSTVEVISLECRIGHYGKIFAG